MNLFAEVGSCCMLRADIKDLEGFTSEEMFAPLKKKKKRYFSPLRLAMKFLLAKSSRE